jgi:hypothetical protein
VILLTVHRDEAVVIRVFRFSRRNVDVQNQMQWNKNAADINLSLALNGIRLDVNVIVVDTYHTSRDRVVTAHPIPDLDLLTTLNERL